MAFNSYMHPRNIYKDRPDFKKIAEDYPEFRKYAVPDFKGKIHVDFSDTEALRAVTKILLQKDFNLKIEIPNGFLIPTVPQRLNYILWIEDLLTLFPKDFKITSGIDIGTGPCAIFSLLGAKKNDWHFISTETSDAAIQWARKNIEANNLEANINVLKVKKDCVLEEMLLQSDDNYDFCLCNPPFFENIDEIRRKKSKVKETIAAFAKEEEIFSDGGEVAFVKKMIKDSLVLKDRISLYTSMFGRKKSFIEILKELQQIKDIVYTKTEFCQGNTIRWGVAWTFAKSVDFEKVVIERPKLKKPKKAKPPFIYDIPQSDEDKNSYAIKNISKNIQNILHNLEILLKVVKSAENFTEIHLTSDKNTWSNQRRKRREESKTKPTEPNCSSVKCPESSSLECTEDQNLKGLEAKSGLNFVVKSEDGLAENNVKSVKVEPEFSFNQGSSSTGIKPIKETISGTVGNDLLEMKSEVLGEISSMGSNDDNFVDSFLAKPQGKTTLLTVPKKRKRDDINSDDTTELDSDIKEEQGELKLANIKSIQNETSVSKKQCLMEDTSSNKRKTYEELNESPKRTKIDSERNQSSDFDPKSLLFSVLKLRKNKDCISLEMNCPPDSNRESMHQIFQLLKNKFQ